MLQYSNGDPPVDVSHLGEPVRDSRDGGPHDLIARDLLLFRWENQGVCAWAVYLDGSDDPPVIVDVNTQFRTWTRCVDSFSQHVYSWVWDYALVMGKPQSNEFFLETDQQRFTEDILSFLRDHFQAELVTYGWPGDTQYRFSADDQRILIWVEQGYANWFLAASTEDTLASLVSKLNFIASFSGTLHAHTAAGQRILEKVRRGF